MYCMCPSFIQSWPKQSTPNSNTIILCTVAILELQHPASSKWPFHSRNGGHLGPEKVTYGSKRGHFEEPGSCLFCSPPFSLTSWILCHPQPPESNPTLADIPWSKGHLLGWCDLHHACGSCAFRDCVKAVKVVCGPPSVWTGTSDRHPQRSWNGLGMEGT